MKNILGLAATVLLLTGCVSPQKIQKTEADSAILRAQLQDRESVEKCSESAMPGTPQHLACRLATAPK